VPPSGPVASRQDHLPRPAGKGRQDDLPRPAGKGRLSLNQRMVQKPDGRYLIYYEKGKA